MSPRIVEKARMTPTAMFEIAHAKTIALSMPKISPS